MTTVLATNHIMSKLTMQHVAGRGCDYHHLILKMTIALAFKTSVTNNSLSEDYPGTTWARGFDI